MQSNNQSNNFSDPTDSLYLDLEYVHGYRGLSSDVVNDEPTDDTSKDSDIKNRKDTPRSI